MNPYKIFFQAFPGNLTDSGLQQPDNFIVKRVNVHK